VPRGGACAGAARLLPRFEIALRAAARLLHDLVRVDRAAQLGGSNRSPESGSISLVMTAPPIIDGGLVSNSCHHQPGLQIFHPQTNYKVQYGGTRL
jgi:hypothetical protein